MMDTPETATTEKQPRAVVPAPNSWVAVLLGLSTFALAATLLVLLGIQYVKSRPVDLIDVSLSAARAVEEKLLTNRVPKENMAISGPSLRKSPEAYWYAHEYEIRLPDYLDADGVTNLIERTVRPYGGYIATMSGNSLALNFGDMTFATVYLSGGAPLVAAAPPLPPRPAIRASANVSPAPVSVGDAGAGDKIARATPAPGATRAWTPPVRTEVASRPLETKPKPIEKALESTRPAKLAIILDDGGYGGPTTRSILSLHTGLTLSILPNTPYGSDTAAKAHELGFEVMLHMPMENTSARLRHDGQIEVAMSAEMIRRLTERALEQIPEAVGINNHTGSKFTESKEAMFEFFRAISDRSLFFVDSKTTIDSVAYDVAKDLGLRTAARDAFLDHDNTPEAIRAQFEKAVELAKDRGTYIAIGHFRRNTAEVLHELLPTLKNHGVELVHVSELLQ